MRPSISALFVAAGLAAAGSTAHAQDAVKMNIVRVGQQGQGSPAFIVQARVALDDLTVQVSCGGTRASTSGPVPRGSEVRLDLKVPKGQHNCTGSLAIRASDGSEGEMPLKFGVTMHPPLEVEVPRESVDLSGRALSVVVDRDAKEVKVEVVGPGGAIIGQGTNAAGPFAAGQAIPLTWTDSGDEVIQLRVVGTDVDGFWSQVDLSPWAYEVPHEDVVFASGQSVIRAEEAPKLEAALVEVDKIVEKYGAVAKINLYVAGYTDTVGPAASNVTLSRARANAIARWFKDHGFAHPIYFQGFGEQGLAVSTPDDTDEAANRRAAYIIAAETPPIGGAIPSRDWKKL